MKCPECGSEDVEEYRPEYDDAYANIYMYGLGSGTALPDPADYPTHYHCNKCPYNWIVPPARGAT